jgi:hypothetical protein
MTKQQSPLRLRKKHSGDAAIGASAGDGQRIVNEQSIRNAVVAGIITVIIFSIFWVSLSDLTNRVYPWFTVVLGFLLGHSVRLAGRGVDWRFPLLAAVLALAGSLFANVVLAASVTADGNDISTLQVLQGVTTMTWPVFFDERLNVADGFFAIIAASLAAFYANRRLSRSQYHALRRWSEEAQGD